MTTSLKKWASGPNMLVLFVAGLLSLLLLFRNAKTSSPQTVIRKRLKAKGYSDEFANWWVAISDHETGTWTSLLYINANNLFGMRQPRQRQTLSLGPVDWKGMPMAVITDQSYSSFVSLENSVDDLVLYFQAQNYPKNFISLYELISFMKKKGYFEAPETLYLTSVLARL